jgi:REP element-mobilizing transposase RayT
MRRSSPQGAQLTFEDLPRWGGRRAGAGRKAAARRRVLHRERPAHKRWDPMHITMRAVSGLPSFRLQMLYGAFERAVRATRRADFRIVEYSVQADHLHLIVEADDKEALARGMKSFSVRANRLFNAAALRGRGRVWGDRYHRRELRTPRQVRNALVYCINNYKKHERVTHGRPVIDLCSSARWFSGWTAHRTADDGPPPTEEAHSFLLRSGWHRHGLIHPGEAPRQAG